MPYQQSSGKPPEISSGFPKIFKVASVPLRIPNNNGGQFTYRITCQFLKSVVFRFLPRQTIMLVRNGGALKQNNQGETVGVHDTAGFVSVH